MHLINIEKRRDNSNWIVEFQTKHQGDLCFMTGGADEHEAIIQALTLAIKKYDEYLELDTFIKFQNIDFEYIKLRIS